MQIAFTRTSDNSNVYLKCGREDRILIAEFIFDDIIFGGNEAMRRSFVEEIRKYF